MGLVGALRVDNMDIYCEDLAAMNRFYTQVLGLRHYLPYEKGQEWVALDAGNLTLYLFQTGGAHPPPRTIETEENPPGFDSVALEVVDLDKSVASLDGLVDWADDGEQRWDHVSASYRYRSFYDPDGNLLHITQPLTRPHPEVDRHA